MADDHRPLLVDPDGASLETPSGPGRTLKRLLSQEAIQALLKRRDDRPCTIKE